MSELVIRFVVGGVVVSACALLGDLFQPKRLAGIFAAAPSVALATLALAVYSQVTAWLLMQRNWSSMSASLVAIVAWFAVAFGLWAACLR